MKKILLSSILISILFAPVLALSAGPIDQCEMSASDKTRIEEGTDLNCELTGTECIFASTNDCGMCCLLNTLYNVATWFFVILVSLSGIYVVMGSMNLLMSGGDPAKIDKGRGYIMYAVIGLILGFLARVIPSLIKLAVG